MGRMLFTVLLATAAVLACSAAPIPDVDSKIGTSVIVNTVARTGIWGRRRHSKMPSSNGKKKVRMMKLRKKELRNKNKRFSDGNGGNRRQFKLKSLRGQNKKNRLAKKTNRDRKNKRDSVTRRTRCGITRRTPSGS